MLLSYTYDHEEGIYLKRFPGLDCILKSVVKTQSRRQSVLVCSLLVASLLLSAVVGGEGELVGSLNYIPMHTTNLAPVVLTSL